MPSYLYFMNHNNNNNITDGCGLSNEAHRELLLKKSKVMLSFISAINSRLRGPQQAINLVGSCINLYKS